MREGSGGLLQRAVSVVDTRHVGFALRWLALNASQISCVASGVSLRIRRYFESRWTNTIIFKLAPPLAVTLARAVPA